MDNSYEYDPFSYALMDSDETSRIIEKTRADSLTKRIVKEVVQIGEASVILRPVK